MTQLLLNFNLSRRFEIGYSRTTWRAHGIVHLLEVGAHSVDYDWPVFRGDS